ncbi:MAG: 4-hydroxythreonine-4-phosphate dehydrogenase PdxA [Planctomycetota bacterium]|jgi:4-hydroxythreonine-4-phosphate dehydrogenase|nr:4-hydroxythreonine-4-phosphate dehydrogenase PdxA [Planctomycetota bacterium]MDP7130313.1 4-hydroxythreonine-4-phosphate dehydrogenase PdxA [Planctomycetota bacterium]MDP7252647.1 4-hydroxythreonine-4-phosphate dehydrogenase PdxA [Planctomycetota bacterium]
MKKIAITMGDPAGIGPEVILKSLASEELKDAAEFRIIGHRRFLERTAATINSDLVSMERLDIVEIGEPPRNEIEPARISADAGRLSVGYLMEAIRLAKEDEIDAIVTAPIHKEAIYKAGFDFPGHTEILAKETDTEKFVMMLVGGPLRVALVTIHVPLRAIFDLITEDSILDTIEVVDAGLKRDFGIPKPRIGVCGLNPHASDGGRFGDEEARIVSPAIRKANDRGFNCSGPLPPDTAFYSARQGEYDGMIALYHDQGLIPIKILAFETGVNVTLGLPIIRTSVDHGTAFNIVGKDAASPASMIEAIKLGVSMAEARGVVG